MSTPRHHWDPKRGPLSSCTRCSTWRRAIGWDYYLGAAAAWEYRPRQGAWTSAEPPCPGRTQR